MLTNRIPLERIFNNDKMWYKYNGLDKKGKPIIEEYPHGAASMVNARYYNFSDNKEELYNYWVEVIANKSEYERMNDEYSKLLDELREKYKNSKKCEYLINDYSFDPFFRYYRALLGFGEITEQEMRNKVINNINVILGNLTIGKVMSEWSKDAQWTDIISNVKYDEKEKIVKIECISFYAMHHYTQELHEDIYDLKTKEGLYAFSKYLAFDRGHWKSLDEVIENYQQHLTKVKTFISSVKKINSKKEKLYGKD